MSSTTPSLSSLRRAFARARAPLPATPSTTEPPRVRAPMHAQEPPARMRARTCGRTDAPVLTSRACSVFPHVGSLMSSSSQAMLTRTSGNGPVPLLAMPSNSRSTARLWRSRRSCYRAFIDLVLPSRRRYAAAASAGFKPSCGRRSSSSRTRGHTPGPYGQPAEATNHLELQRSFSPFALPAGFESRQVSTATRGHTPGPMACRLKPPSTGRPLFIRSDLCRCARGCLRCPNANG